MYVRGYLQGSENDRVVMIGPESRLDNGVFSNDLSHTGIGHVLENIDQVLKIHSFLSLWVSNITKKARTT